MSYTHFTIIEHSKVETLLELGFSIYRIAQKLVRVSSFMLWELKRTLNHECNQAEKQYEQKSKWWCKIKNDARNQKNKGKLNQIWSPE